MPSPSRSSGKRTPEGAKQCIDIEAQAAIPSTSGRHVSKLTYDGYYDHPKPQNPLVSEIGVIKGSMPVAFKVRPQVGKVPALTNRYLYQAASSSTGRAAIAPKEGIRRTDPGSYEDTLRVEQAELSVRSTCQHLDTGEVDLKARMQRQNDNHCIAARQNQRAMEHRGAQEQLV